jgi:hypothetical protein
MMNVRIDQDQLAGAKLMLGAVGRSVNPIIYRAINRTEDNAQVRAVDLIYEILNLTKTRIRQDFRKVRASLNRLSGQLNAEGLPVGFMSFAGTRELARGRGVSVRIKRLGGRREYFRHAFIAPGRGGNEQVFEREEWYGRTYRPGYPYWKMPRDYRFGLDRLSAVAIEDYYKDQRIYQPVLNYAGDRLVININSQIDYEFSRI